MHGEEPFRGYARVFAFSKTLNKAIDVARREAKKLRTTVYVGEPRARSHAASQGQYVVWAHIATDDVSKLSYDPKLKTMPWLDLRELHHSDWAIDPPSGRRPAQRDTSHLESDHPSWGRPQGGR